MTSPTSSVQNSPTPSLHNAPVQHPLDGEAPPAPQLDQETPGGTTNATQQHPKGDAVEFFTPPAGLKDSSNVDDVQTTSKNEGTSGTVGSSSQTGSTPEAPVVVASPLPIPNTGAVEGAENDDSNSDEIDITAEQIKRNEQTKWQRVKARLSNFGQNWSTKLHAAWGAVKSAFGFILSLFKSSKVSNLQNTKPLEETSNSSEQNEVEQSTSGSSEQIEVKQSTSGGSEQHEVKQSASGSSEQIENADENI